MTNLRLLAVAPTLRAALLLLPAMLPIAGGLGRALVALRGPEPHVCVCPLDAEGDCQCPDCILLGIHDRHDDEHEHEAAEPARLDPGPQIASACTPAPGDEPAPPALERAVLPSAAPLLAAAPYTISALSDAPPLSARQPEPPVPPPRLA